MGHCGAFKCLSGCVMSKRFQIWVLLWFNSCLTSDVSWTRKRALMWTFVMKTFFPPLADLRTCMEILPIVLNTAADRNKGRNKNSNKKQISVVTEKMPKQVLLFEIVALACCAKLLCISYIKVNNLFLHLIPSLYHLPQSLQHSNCSTD